MAKYPFDQDAAFEVLRTGVPALEAVANLIMQSHGVERNRPLDTPAVGIGELLRLIHGRLEEGMVRAEAEHDELIKLRQAAYSATRPNKRG